MPKKHYGKTIGEEQKKNYIPPFDKKELERYESSYHNILWLDDLDSGQVNSKISWMKAYLIKKDSAFSIELVDTFEKAVDDIIDKHSDYDLVIFDMDFNKGLELECPKELLEDKFKKYHIHLSYTELVNNKETAGIYLYLLLLSMGYPIERMLIYTGDGYEKFISKVESTLGYLDFNESSIVKKKKDSLIDIESYFSGEQNQYYRIRRLVFQACEHWKNWLENEKNGKKQERKPEEIPFNHVYFCEEPEKENQISCESFKEMLDRVKMLFPVVQPSNTEQVYYQALQMAAMMHEESADIKKVKGFFQPWHSMIRNFRNWGAHNKFENASLDGEQFAFLFCIALRTFFDEKQINNLHEFSDFYEYETIFDFQNSYKEGEECTEIKADFTEETLEQALCKIWQELRELEWKNINSTANALNIDGELSNLIWKIPRNCKTKMESKKYLFVPVWCRKKETCGDEISIKPNSSEFEISSDNSSDNKTLKNSVSYTYTWNYEKDTLQKICDKAKKDTPEAVFMRYCYRWLSQEEKS